MDKKITSLNYFDIFKQAGKITLQKRYLWWFGFFVALANIGGINYFSDFNNDKDFSKFFREKEALDFIPYQIFSPGWIVAGIVILLLICLFLIILNNLGRGALISSINNHIEGKTSDFKSGMRKGRRNFWKIFFISFFLGIFMLGTVIVLFAPVIFLFLNSNYIIGVFMATLASLILIPLIILSAYLRIYAYLYAVLGNLNIWASLERAYDIFQKNMKVSIIMGLLFIPINILLVILIITAIIPIVITFVVLGLILFLIAGKIGVGIAIAIGLIIIILCILAIKSVYEVFSQSVWILFFHEIAKLKKEELITEPEPEPIPETKPFPIIESRKK